MIAVESDADGLYGDAGGTAGTWKRISVDDATSSTRLDNRFRAFTQYINAEAGHSPEGDLTLRCPCEVGHHGVV